MELKELVELVVDLVLGEYQPRQGKALVCVTGARINKEKALEELHSLWQQGWEFKAAFTQGGKKVVGEDLLREILPGVEIVAENTPPYSLVKWADLVLLPTLTINTAAKMAATLADNLVVTAVLEALLMGKPVVAVSDMANPRSPQRARLGMNRGRAALESRLTENLTQLEAYGVTLVPASQLAATASALLKGEKPTSGQGWDRPKAQSLVALEDVLLAAAREQGQILVPPGAIVTPLARERAGELHIKLIERTGEG